ncbi:hypothetical protein OOZ15_05315 [Galbibacter sp. EGI 63066]|uniref:PilN domain-containing protein n=1 Tax=Galbibacter sp. EGI 63066 TaxID=2993559 RepID=UPI002248ED34|nr:PilN domain-containing protein [Galbibacter sp. EGI 63066]MCX2679355.1 hypothetical protein [Galbibacter sp. EGI 63066]
MYNRLISYIKEGSVYNTLEVFSSEGKEKAILCNFKKLKSAIELEQSHTIEDIAGPNGLKSGGKDSFLIINTDHVITKIVDTTNMNDLSLLNSAFPNLKIDDFYYEIARNQKQSVIAICRKKDVGKYLELFSKNNIECTGFSLGISNLNTVTPYLDTNTVRLNNKIVALEDNSISNITPETNSTSQEYDLNGLTINNEQLLGFANVLAYLQAGSITASNFDEINKSLKEEHQHRRIFSLGLKASLGLILFILLINYIAYSHYFNKNEGLQQTRQVNIQNKQKILELDKTVKAKEKMINDMISSSSSKVSLYLNDIVNSLPSSVLLNKLIYQPIEKQIRPDKEILMQKKHINIEGLSSDSKTFSKWVEKLEDHEWIDNVEITSYEYSKNKASLFSITITIDHEE